MLGAGPSVRFTLEQANTIARMARNLKLFADSLDAAWQDWILGFSVEDQMALLKRLRLSDYREYGLVVLMLAAVGLALGILVVATMRERRPTDPLQVQYDRFCRRMERIGLPRATHEGPIDYGRRIARARPDLERTVDRVLAIYVPARYGRADPTQAVTALSQLLRDFAPRAARHRP
jgi:hypothetical protein